MHKHKRSKGEVLGMKGGNLKYDLELFNVTNAF
jgi:hypothetical protein